MRLRRPRTPVRQGNENRNCEARAHETWRDGEIIAALERDEHFGQRGSAAALGAATKTRKTRKRRFFELADRLNASEDAGERRRLKEERARLTLGE
jgi:hypothetical protein